jgi:23S rRNA (pseudouridine1915-N3)-methyltransferase
VGTFTSHSAREGQSAREDESERLLGRLRDSDFVVLLDERGKLVDSPSLAKLLLSPIESSKTIVCIIGGAYGVDTRLHERADFIWSLSPLVFPHQLVRLILAEQLYRAQEIAGGRPYHHE